MPRKWTKAQRAQQSVAIKEAWKRRKIEQQGFFVYWLRRLGILGA